MAKNNVIPAQKIEDASGGNAQLREILQSLTNTGNLQITATNTGGKNAPPQVRADVSYLKSVYYVTVTNPGAIPPVSGLQANQAVQGSSQQSNIAPVTPIYHQIRVATSPRFSISDNVQTFGGDTGSTQTYWEISSLGTGRWYFQIRSSYDGSTWNLWRNANGGQTITGGQNGITVEAVTNGVAALFTLPGDQLLAVIGAYAFDGQPVGVPSSLYTSALQAIAGPNGYTFQPSNLAHGIIADAVAVQVPNPEPPTDGPPDFPLVVAMKYQDGSSNIWQGSANCFMLAYDPLGTNVTEETTADGVWVDFILPGGAHFSVGTGVTNDGSAIALPSTMPWVDPSRFLSIVSPALGFDATRQARGITQARITAGVMHCQFEDTTAHAWSSTGNWFVVSWSPGFSLIGGFLVFTLPSGQRVAFGSGSGANGSTIALPSWATMDKMIDMATPASADATSHPMAGVFKCDVATNLGPAPVLQLTYDDTQGNSWSGNVNWMVFVWE